MNEEEKLQFLMHFIRSQVKHVVYVSDRDQQQQKFIM